MFRKQAQKLSYLNKLKRTASTLMTCFFYYLDELQTLLDNNKDQESCDTFESISEENDHKCWTYLKVRCSLLQRAYSAVCNLPEIYAEFIYFISCFIALVARLTVKKYYQFWEFSFRGGFFYACLIPNLTWISNKKYTRSCKQFLS